VPLIRFRSLALLAAWAVCALAAPLHSQAWTPLGPFGGPVRALTASPSGVVYAADFQGVFRSVNAGESWSLTLAAATLTGVVVDPSRPSVAYVIAHPGVVFKSTDAGAHWNPINRGLPAGQNLMRSLAVDPANPNRLYIGGMAGLFRSTDSGASWQPLSSALPTPATALAALRRPVGTVFAGTETGLFLTRDGGASWRGVTSLPVGTVSAVVPAPSDPRTVYVLYSGAGLFRSRDAGNTWEPVSRPPSPDRGVYSLSVDPRSARVLYAGVQGGTLRSADGGRSWVRLGTPPGAGPVIVTADPAASRRLYAGLAELSTTAGGVFRSDDGGATWQRRSQGYFAFDIPSVSISPDDPDQVWASVHSSFFLFRSSNGGQRWVRLPSSLGGFPGSRRLSVASATIAFVEAFAPPPFFYSLLRTEDAGASWVPALRIARPSLFMAHRIAPSDAATVYALQYNGLSIDLLRSTNAGFDWELRAPLTSLGCGNGDLAVAPSSASTVYAFGSGPAPSGSCNTLSPRVIRSRDGGATFTDASAGLPAGIVTLASVDPHDPDVVYAEVQAGRFQGPQPRHLEDGGRGRLLDADRLSRRQEGHRPARLRRSGSRLRRPARRRSPPHRRRR